MHQIGLPRCWDKRVLRTKAWSESVQNGSFSANKRNDKKRMKSVTHVASTLLPTTVPWLQRKSRVYKGLLNSVTPWLEITVSVDVRNFEDLTRCTESVSSCQLTSRTQGIAGRRRQPRCCDALVRSHCLCPLPARRSL